VGFDLQPHLKGELIELRPLTSGDWDELFAVASDSLIWEQHPERDRYKEHVFKSFFREALECDGAFAVIDRKIQQIIGSTRFYDYNPEKSEIEIGWTFLARKYWGGRYNREMKDLLLGHAFEFVEKVIFLVGEQNFRSQKALEKIGAIKIGMAARTYGHHPRAINVKFVMRKS
jgi:RimJ/RimL family protein N-acetyltransferase